MKALVTGGAGYIGSHLVKHLVAHNIETIVYDNLSSGQLKNLESVWNDIKFIKGDICDYKNLVESMKNIDYVFHQAALVSVPGSILNPQLTQQVNIMGSLNVLQAALKTQVSRAILASSCAVYGDRHQPPFKENLPPFPKSPYAASKIALEALAESFYHTYGLETICLRYFNVYGGEKQSVFNNSGVIPKIIDSYQKRQNFRIYGDGKQTRDFVHVKDIVRANILAANLSSKVLETYRIFNIGTGVNINLLEIIKLVSIKFGYQIETEFLPDRHGDVYSSWADISRSQEWLNFLAEIKLSNFLVQNKERENSS